MKRCPECGRDYNDDSMSFCLDDGSELLFGPASGSGADEPATAILHETAPPAEAQTRAQIHTTEQTAVLLSGVAEMPKAKGIDKRLLLAPVALAIIVLSGFFGYRYITQAKQIESIAVMPFKNESGNPEVEYLSDGMTETLIKSLSEVPHLAVKSRSTVFYYKGKETIPKKIGEELGVQAVLLGRIDGRGEDLRLSLELVNTGTQDVIWTESYQRKQSDLVSLQSEIAKDVSTNLKAKLTGAEESKVTRTGTADPEAYQAYLKGRYYWNRRTAENIKKAIEQFMVAVDRDPNYAMAYVGLAECYAILNEYSGIPLSETLPEAKVYAERAIAIDGQLAEPHATLGLINEFEWNWTEAEREYKRAIELNPNYATAFHWYSTYLKDTGRFDEGALMSKRAHEIDPLSSVITREVSMFYQLLNQHQASIDNSLKLIDLDPNFPAAHQYLGLSYLKLGRNAEGVAALEKAAELSNRAAWQLGDLGYGYAVTGKRAEAMAIVKELEEKYAKREANAQNIAAVYAGLGNKDKAFEWLETGFRTKADLTYLKWAIPYESLRDDPRYTGLLKRMGLPE